MASLSRASQAFSHASEPKTVPGKRARPRYRDGGGGPPPGTRAGAAPRGGVASGTARAAVSGGGGGGARALRSRPFAPASAGAALGDLYADPRVRPADDEVDLWLACEYEELAVPETEGGPAGAGEERVCAEYVPSYIGRDAATQVEGGDLFDFDAEVKPLLEVLVGRTCHVAVVELQEEKEVRQMVERRAAFETARDTELAELQRLEAQLKRQRAEKGRREEQSLQLSRTLSAQTALVSARGASARLMAEVEAEAMAALRGPASVAEALEREIASDFMPWLLEGVQRAAEVAAAADDLLEEAVRGALLRAAALQRAARGRTGDGGEGGEGGEGRERRERNV